MYLLMHRELSGKWFKLWKWYLITFLGIFAGTILTVLIALLGMLVMLVCTIGTLIVSILKVVYIYKMANVLKKGMRVNAMIRRMQFTDLDKVSQIWLESNKEAHGFIPAEYWESHLQFCKNRPSAGGSLCIC